MAEKRTTYKLQDVGGIGEVKIADEVVTVIAGLAATEVEGVASMEGNITNELVSKLGVNGDQLVHLLAAADHGHTRVLHHGDEVSAMLTNKKSLFHGDLLSSSVDFSPAPAWARHRFSLSSRC